MVEPWALAPGGVGDVAMYCPSDSETLAGIFWLSITGVNVVASRIEAAGDIASGELDEGVKLFAKCADKEEDSDVGEFVFNLKIAESRVRMSWMLLIAIISPTERYTLHLSLNGRLRVVFILLSII